MSNNKPLSEKINPEQVMCRELDLRVLMVKDVRLAVLRILERIRLSPNRDDKIVPMEEPKLKLMFLDGGGIGKEEVKNIIKEEMGKELIGGEK